MLTIRQEKASDVAAREALLDAAYPARSAKPSERLRAGRQPARGLALVAVEDGRVVGTVRLWEVSAGANRPALLLGPLAVDPTCRRRGIGSMLMRRALATASRRGHRAVLLVGDAAYYARFGFSAERASPLWLPGLSEPHRLLGCELAGGAFDGTRGAIQTPAKRPRRSLAAAIAGLAPSPKPQAA
jgi:predicted N-acetyltransferase YhbS